MDNVVAFAVDLEARLKNFEKQMVQAANMTDTKLRGIERRFASANDNIAKSLNTDKVRAGLLATATAFGAAFSAREVAAIADTYTRFTNSLKVAGVQGAALVEVQNELFRSAQKNGVELEALGSLYGRASQAAKSLGATQSDLLKFTDGVTNALRIQGGDPAAASGALLQLSQALQSGTVRAEEFNSVNEGAFPILQAVAAGADRFGGSVAKLRAEVLAGKVSSQEFFQAFLAGSSTLEDRAAKSTLTTAQAFTQLRNALVQYVGVTDQSSGASAAMASGIKGLADNIDVIIPAIGVLGVALGVGFVANAGRAAVAARGVGGAILGAFGGPVGLAITAITVAVASLAGEAATASREVSVLEGTTGDLKGTLADARAMIDPTPGKLASIGEQALGAVPGIKAFAGEVGAAAAKLWELAAAQKAAAINKLMGERAGLSKEIETAEQRLPQQRRAAFASDFGFGNHGSLSDQFGRARRFAAGELANIWTGGKSDQEAADAVAAAKARMKEVEDGIRALGNADLQQFADEAKAVQAATGGTPGKTKTGKGSKAATGGVRGFLADPVTVDRDSVVDLNGQLSGRAIEVDSSPAGFESSADRVGKLNDDLKDMADRQYAGIYNATYGALDAAFRGGASGVLQYFAQQLEQQALHGLASGIAKGLSQKAGSGIVSAIATAFGGGFSDGGYLGGFAGGGMLRGPGTGTSDSILATNGQGKYARFSNGEFVVNAAATRQNRVLLEALNSGQMPKFATGGFIGQSMPSPASLGRGGTTVVQQYFPNFSGAVVTEDLIKQFHNYADRAAQQAAVQGAKGGAALARVEAINSEKNRLGMSRRW